MRKQPSPVSKSFLFVLAITGWFALIAQFYLTVTLNEGSTLETIIRYFTYFTITTNILVAVCCTAPLLRPASKWAAFFSRQQTLTAVTVYILVVGIIYNIILREIWKPEGLQMVVNELLHSVIPLLFLIYWLAFVPKDQLKWKDFLPWLIYPFIYVVVILIRGAASGFYPYPFINVTDLGATTVFINSTGIAIAFLLLSLMLIGLAKLMSGKKPSY